MELGVEWYELYWPVEKLKKSLINGHVNPSLNRISCADIAGGP